MKPLPGTVHGAGDPFEQTEWTVVLAAGNDATPDTAQAALAKLCEIYWPPLYTFVRSRGYAAHDAQDLTQGFFAYLIEHKIYARVERGKGKFRSFLLASLKNYLADSRDRQVAWKRGGSCPLLNLHGADVAEAKSLFHTHSTATGDDCVFERSWAEKLVSTALARLSADFAAEERNPVQGPGVFLTAGPAPLPTYEELATRLHIPVLTLRSHVNRLRVRYRQAVRREVRRTVSTEAEVDGEVHELLRVLAA